MQKKELADMVAEATRYSKYKVENTITQIFGVIAQQLSEGNEVYIRGFGPFTPQLRKAKKARDINRNKLIVVPEHYTAKLRPSKSLDKYINIKHGKQI